MDTTYVQAYGVYQGFIARGDLIKKHWLEDADGNQIKLEGKWHKSGFFSTDENFFTVSGIAGEPVSAEEVPNRLLALAQQTLTRHYGEEYAQNISCFASDSSVGYEYPILTPKEATEIHPLADSLGAAATLRYAYASNYAYALETDDYSLVAEPLFQKLMVPSGAQKPTVLEESKGEKDIFAVALKVPAVEGLPEEIIIAYKGTNFGRKADRDRDIEIGLENFKNYTEWDRNSYAFLQKVLANFGPNEASFARGFNGTPRGAYNVVLTGHSLGAYTATGMGTRTGIKTRVFSSPATKIVESLPKFFANTMWMRNVMNYFRKSDLVVSTGRHDENRISFPAHPEGREVPFFGWHHHPGAYALVRRRHPGNHRSLDTAQYFHRGWGRAPHQHLGR
ncbi:MAG: hypothetical protein AAFQ98_25395 [Bacteroidota bacterium]